MSSNKFFRMPIHIYTFFGKPGAGKTTLAAYIANQYMNKNIPVYSNVPIIGTYKINKSQIGAYSLPLLEADRCVLIIDEAIVEYSNREFKSNLNKFSNEWWHEHRHAHCSVYLFSQSYDGFDRKLRDLTFTYYIVKPSIFTKKLVYAHRISMDVDINKMTDQIEDKYKFDPFFLRLFTTKRAWGPSVYDLFDSYDMPYRPPLPLVKYESKHVGVDPLPDQESIVS